MAAGAVTAAIAAVIVTPLCGVFFDCGCTWPWAGLESDCNIHDPAVTHACPWCVSTVAGVGSVGLAMVAAITLAIAPCWPGRTRAPDIGARTFSGTVAFIIVAMLGAYVSARWQDYPTFIY